jgi:hypothetical protein
MDRIVKLTPRPGSDEEVRASVSQFKGRTYVAIRVYYKDSLTGEMRPGKNGINLPVEEAEALFGGAEALKAALVPATV